MIEKIPAMRFFLKMKHWQLFLLFIILPGLGEYLLEQVLPLAAWVAPALNAVVALLAVSYLWTLGLHLYAKAPRPLSSLSPAWFRAGLLYAFIDLVLLGLFADQLIPEHPKSPYYIVPLHAVAMAGIFYAFYFVAKSLSSIEKGSEADLNDFAGPFFMLWFFPLGVWFFQPKVNRVEFRDVD